MASEVLNNSLQAKEESEQVSLDTQNGIFDNLGREGAERIINDTTPFPEGVYRPNYYAFTSEKEETKEKGLSLVKRKKERKK
jgi:hypothetical protein